MLAFGVGTAEKNMPDHDVYPPFARSRICHVGTYRRVLPVSIERMYENALDWEHLPFVHAGSFAAIEGLASGPWGWRAEVTTPRGDRSVIELRLDRACRRWITRTLEGGNAGGEIWTHAFSIEPRRVDIVVDFFVPGVEPEAREKVGRSFAALYERLYDEDVAMMTERQRRLDARVETHRVPQDVRLGARSALELPARVEFGGRPFVVTEIDGALCAYSALCPHQLGPLHASPAREGTVQCPWHGYRFDVITGRCVSGQECRLATAPVVHEDDAGTLWLRLETMGH